MKFVTFSRHIYLLFDDSTLKSSCGSFYLHQRKCLTETYRSSFTSSHTHKNARDKVKTTKFYCVKM